MQELRSFDNFTTSQGTDAYGFVENLTWGSYLNNSIKQHLAWNYNQTINMNTTMNVPDAVWFYSEHENLTWTNRTADGHYREFVETGPNDDSRGV